jgi:DNA-binding transcriptional LysR family regulator
VFAEYCRLYPPVQINIYRNFSYKVTEKLENGAIEVGFLTLPIQSPSLEIQTIFRDKLMLMVSPRNPLAKHKTASVSDIVKHPSCSPRQAIPAGSWTSCSALIATNCKFEWNCPASA